MSRPFPQSDEEIIDAPPPRRHHWRRWFLGGLVLLFIILSRSLSIYVSALWFGSLGYSSVYWYILKLKVVLFLAFLVLTLAILRGAFWLLERMFAAHVLEPRTIMLNNQPFQVAPARFLRPVSWAVALVFGLFSGLAMKSKWLEFANYVNQAPTSLYDPIFQKSLAFYLFSLPILDSISSWLVTLTFVILCAALLYSLLSIPQKVLKSARSLSSKTAFAAVSIGLAAFLLALAWRTWLSRFPYLWSDHQTISGVTYTEANYLLPGLLFVAVALVIAALISLINAFTKRGLRLLFMALAIPIAVYVVGVVIVPTYVHSFIVKPNEIGRETPYIEHNIAWTRRAFGLEQIESREFEAEPSIEALNLDANRATLENIRLWDWRALQDTLKQVQTIRTYYDFLDVDVDRYSLGGQTRQVMLAARELDVEKLPESSRNWINEKLIYTHGYGVTMNTANGFTPEGMPRFVLSDMPIKSSAPEAVVTRPQIYYGQKTDTDVYVKTAQKEFDFPQGETNTYTTYEGTGGIEIGGRFRRMLLAWALDDLSKLPFSDDITPQSRVLIHRNIREIVDGIAPFLIYDNDPYMVVSKDGRLFWMLDAFTESTRFPYSRHHQVGGDTVNYIRNSVKVVIDAYNGSVDFYVFDLQDPIVATYRAIFPSLFKDASLMPADLRSHVRYPETLIRVQAEVYGLYHTQSPKVFFQREDVWSVASQLGIDDQNKKQAQPIDPYYVLMQLPGEPGPSEFALILPFTPSNRNNMIGWMAGRSDGENYGKLLVYNFPESRLIEGPLQIEARIDQNAQLSAQFSLWNQQGSRVLRGHLLVIPIGRSLLYVEPVYLQAQRSPMPELRLVVLAIQERVAYGQSFEEALSNLIGEAGKTALPAAEQTTDKPSPGATPPVASAIPTAASTFQQLVIRAIQEFEEYERLTAQGKHAEAGQKLEQHKRTLDELRRMGTKP
ncbi:MAG: UPF0182 family membrane protein [Pyrinomonadaceae bacterium]